MWAKMGHMGDSVAPDMLACPTETGTEGAFHEHPVQKSFLIMSGESVTSPLSRTL